jgi:putative SOS response-associated peptidase YedK
MPVILSEPEEWDAWLSAPWAKASRLQRPFPAERMTVVATGGKQDSGEVGAIHQLLL